MLLAAALSATSLATTTSSAGAEEPVTTLTLTAPPSVRLAKPTDLTATLITDGAPVAGQTIAFERKSGTTWVPIGSAPTDAAGLAVLSPNTTATSTVYRAVHAGPPITVSSEVMVTGFRAPSTLTLSAPAWYVIDEHSRVLTASWRADGVAVDGMVTLQQRAPGSSRWSTLEARRTWSDGKVTFTVRPRGDRYYRVWGGMGRWWLGMISTGHFLDNRPPAAPVIYPRSAPKPASLASNARAQGTGPNATISPISSAMWRSMVGRTWHRGCPVGRSSLRVIRINYFGYNGYRYRGELVVNAAIARRAVAALSEMYAGRYPIWRMHRVDRFGWSTYLRGGNDYASMRSGNTSAFNCRGVVGNPRVLSPHSRGRSIDLNTWENPYASRTGIVPNTWWYSRSHPRIAWRSGSHPVLRIWRKHGFRWTYGVADSQHYDGRRTGVPTATMTG